MVVTDRRQLILGSAAIAAAGLFGVRSAPAATTAFHPLAGPRSRTLYVNDLSGDIDGLFATVHYLLSYSTDRWGIVGTGTDRAQETAARSAEIAREILGLMRMTAEVKVFEGAGSRLKAVGQPVRSAGTQAIIDEALRTDTQLPLFVAVGGGLTEVASALMIEPRIADRFTLVWIGGDTYPAGGTGETNFGIDPVAAQFIFNETRLRIWQVPRGVYGTCLVSATELQAFVAPNGAIGEWLYEKVANAPLRFKNYLNMGETWTLGDSPLVLLTALGDWVPSLPFSRPLKYDRTGSSAYDTVPTPRLNPDGTFAPRPDGREMRTYKSIDTRLMFSDFFAKLKLAAPRRA